MSRIIKFRAWDSIDNRWLPLDQLSLRLSDSRLIPVSTCAGLGNSSYPGRIILEQFTGLKDKNGRDIYEGDIIRTDPEHFIAIVRGHRESDEYTEYTEYTNAEAMWWNNGFAVGQAHIGATRISEYATCDCCPCGLEIIGNIHETPSS